LRNIHVFTVERNEPVNGTSPAEAGDVCWSG
jgi:hypothetical protein